MTTDRTETGDGPVTVNRDDYDAVLNLAERLWRIAEHHPNCTLSGLPESEVEAFARLLHADQAHMPKRLRENVNRHRTGYLRAAIDRIEATPVPDSVPLTQPTTATAASPEYARGFADGYEFASVLADEAWRAQHGLPMKPREIHPPTTAPPQDLGYPTTEATT